MSRDDLGRPHDTSVPGRLAPETRVVVGGRPAHDPGAALSTPITMSSTYVAGGDPALAYGRYANPVWTSFEEVLGDLEGGRAFAFASGMAAITATLEIATERALAAAVPATGLPVVLSPAQAYSGTLHLLPADRYLPVDIDDTTAVIAALDACTRPIACLWIESPTNPGLQVADVATLTAAAHERGILVVVDNTFATPISSTPLALGVDIVVHSVTKMLAGHSDVVLGAAVTRDCDLAQRLLERRTKHGAIASPFDTWLALRGMRTLALRVERASSNALELATRLVRHPAVSRVLYPGLPTDPGYTLAQKTLKYAGSIVCIEFAGGVDAAEELCDSVRLWVPATSLGGVESTLERRRRWPSESLQVDESLVRLSVGIEDVDDLWADLAQALDDLTG
ncbi:MAG TPA: aminotransferase class I/II-fold pyridoxal phosphate-dependent enzyme [Actinopolymorphaceae bacterium]|jgi:cystathionine gamma-synthase